MLFEVILFSFDDTLFIVTIMLDVRDTSFCLKANAFFLLQVNNHNETEIF
jgi:hypothetical protein